MPASGRAACSRAKTVNPSAPDPRTPAARWADAIALLLAAADQDQDRDLHQDLDEQKDNAP